MHVKTNEVAKIVALVPEPVDRPDSIEVFDHEFLTDFRLSH